MKLRALPSSLNVRGKRVLLRVDWNIPLKKNLAVEDTLKIKQSLSTIEMLTKRGASVVVMTHLGRPEGEDPSFSTQHLVPIIKRLNSKLSFELLENVRFNDGEETDDHELAQEYAAQADLFVNDAFASCHRAHASVVGITKYLPSFAGPNLTKEVAALSGLLQKSKHPFVVVMGGLKISTKLPVLKALLPICDQLLVGGAIAQSPELPKHKKILWPIDTVTGHGSVADIGPKTVQVWSELFQSAGTILWNGPVGIVEEKTFARGSLAVAKAIARAPKKIFKVVGGGDTIPLVIQSKTEKDFDHVSMGGGAMLEFISKKGKLPGLVPLIKK